MRASRLLICALPFALMACNPATPSSNASNNSDSSNTAQVDTTSHTSKLPQVDSLVMGIDVNAEHGPIDWAQAKAEGIDFMYALAAKGAKVGDDQFSANWEGAGKNGIRRGAILYYQFGTSFKDHLANFQKHVTLSEGDLAPVIRVDGGSIPHNVRVNPVEVEKEILGCLKEFEKALGCKPIIYTTLTAGNNYMKNKAFSEYPLWIAVPTETIKLPEAWKDSQWALWMYSKEAPMAGCTKMVKRSKFHATSLEFDQEMPCLKP